VALREEQTIVGQNAAAIGGILLHAVPGRVLDPTAEGLEADFGTACSCAIIVIQQEGAFSEDQTKALASKIAARSWCRTHARI
jgi:hypothetical protein